MLIWPMIAFGWVINQLQQGSASMARLSRIMDTEPAIRDPSRDPGHRPRIMSVKGRSNSGTSRSACPGRQWMRSKDLAHDPPAGRTLAVVGIPVREKHDGEPDSAPVRRHRRGAAHRRRGRPEYPLKVLRGAIGYVPQETFLFSESIADNIAYGMDGGTGADVREAAEIARIAHDIAEFPKGYETFLGERGITLSGGQKQRTSIARAVMRKPAILILDDALSAVDTFTEEGILSRLRGVMKGRTSIIISHRISTVKDADSIVVLDGGGIREQGTHDELVALGGIYAELHRKQLLEEELEQL